ncbi:MAG: ClpXP protease specificity-enhancing factor [Gammaproteobacteria bacterium]|nr:ClpXP protease specificity-enhancing factor [Gammaproteobacteria bacterium]
MSAPPSGTGPARSRRPYLLRAMHEWMSDSGFTPHVIVDAGRPGVAVPAAYIKDGKIVLNLSWSATQHLTLGNDWIEFDARFGGIAQHVRVPVSAVLGVYARETGEGMVFADGEGGPPPPPPQEPGAADAHAAGSEGKSAEKRKRPKLEVVK